jgi:hypothetical protein
MGYHKRVICKGVFGEFSKVQEEFEELLDAKDQCSKVLESNIKYDMIYIHI